jgi:hypothetical protein
MKTKCQKGGTALAVLVALTVILTVMGGVLAANTTNLRVTRRNMSNELAYQAAQAGLEMQTARAVGALPANNGVFASGTSDVSADLSAVLPGCAATATVSPQSDPTWAYVTCSVKYNHYTRSVRQLINAKNVGIWNNAIFAGTGAAGAQINGNVDIRGSVHTLGDGEDYLDVVGLGTYFSGDPYTDKNHNGKWDPGETFTDLIGDHIYHGPDPYNDTNGNGVYDPPLTSASLDAAFSGNAEVGNNYQNIPLNLQTCIPNCPTIGGVLTLSSEVRVKHGKISLSGAATIGQVGPVNGGSMKATVDGTYVNDGFSGTKGSASVYSDNGSTNQYDLGFLGIKYPLISGIGAPPYIDKTGTTWSTQEAYLDARSLTCPVTTITSKTAAFTYGPDAYGNRISFTPAVGQTPCLLTINGIVHFTSTLQLGAKDQIFYAGSGTLFSDVDILVDGDVLPQSGLVFPTTARLGFIAKRNLGMATGNGSSQLTTTGAYYAQGDITTAKQTNTAGTFVGNFFNMGTNVPSIFQVPSLPYNMPPGMPGDKTYYSIKIKGWRDRFSKPDDVH